MTTIKDALQNDASLRSEYYQLLAVHNQAVANTTHATTSPTIETAALHPSVTK